MPSSITSSDTGSDRIRVLLVDDNQTMLARAETVLAATCAVVGEAHDGEAAIAAAAALRPDVIVLDISMPEMSGLEVATRLRLAGSTAEIVFLTVHDDAEFVEAAQAAGGIGYVVKAKLATDLPQAVREAREHRPFVSLLH
jgi:DNA-binding NarL/FixJ family response regulator